MEFTSSLFGDIAVDFNPGLGFDVTDPDHRSRVLCCVLNVEVLIEPRNIARVLDIIATSFTTPIEQLSFTQSEYIFQDENNSAALQRLLAHNVCTVKKLTLMFDQWDEIPYNVDLLAQTLHGNTSLMGVRCLWIKPDAAAAAMLAICRGPNIEEVEMRVGGASFGKDYHALFDKLHTQLVWQCDHLSDLRIHFTKRPRFDWEFYSHMEAAEVFDVIRRMSATLKILVYECWEWPNYDNGRPELFSVLGNYTGHTLAESNEGNPYFPTTSFGREKVLLFTALAALQRRTLPEYMRPEFQQTLDIFSTMAHQRVYYDCDHTVSHKKRYIVGVNHKYGFPE